MADRLSVKDILAAVRNAAPVQAAGEVAAEPTAEVAAEAQEAAPAGGRGDRGPRRPRLVARPPDDAQGEARRRPPRRAPRATGREHARGGPGRGRGGTGGRRPRRPSRPAAPSLGRPMTLQGEARRGPQCGASAVAPHRPPAKPSRRRPAAAKPAAAKAATARELPPLDKITDPKDLAEALRQAGAKQDKTIAAEKGEAAGKAAPAKAAAKPKAEAKTVPGRPSRAASLTEATRRQLFGIGFWIAAGWVSFTAGMSALTVMLGRFMLPNVLAEPPSTVKVGVPGDFAREDVSERFKTEWGFWIVRTEKYNGQDVIFALQSICTHLGCPPNWLAGEQKFKCPCHGSGFYISGINFEGPAPRPLERFKVAMADDGQILVDKSQKFQEELAQWSDPDSFLPAV